MPDTHQMLLNFNISTSGPVEKYSIAELAYINNLYPW